MNGVSLLNRLIKGFSNELSSDVLILGLQTDSRKVQKGDLFIAYPGMRSDGRQYIKEAIDKQAVAVFFDPHDYKPSIESPVPLIPISRLQNQVGEIAARFYSHPTKHLKIIGVTGTNGKTSCTHFIAQLLQSQGMPCAVVGTLGYGFVRNLTKTNYTTPDPLQLQQAFVQMRTEGARAVVMEVSSHALDQHRVNGVHFDIAVFTQLSRDHLDYHGSMENYARAKELLFEKIGLSYGVVNCDDEFGRYLIAKYHKKLMLIGYSMKGIKNDRVPLIMATAIKTLDQGFSVTVQTPWGNGTLTTPPLFGRFNISNLLAVIGVLGLSGVSLEKSFLELSKLKNVPGRMQLVECASGPQVVVDYAHTPDALEKALMSLREHCRGQLICIFGCGGDRDRGKRPQMGAIAERYTDQVIVTNDNPRSESPLAIIQDIKAGFKNPQSVVVETDRAAAIHYAVQKATVDDIVLIAGKGYETTQVIGRDVLPFDDVQEAQKALNL
ncbi:UDP-N-acetylmuramoyl-L-alanyl-D-glutamate--2,6-diaminopimelate ligase [Coxiella-like endosymbiont]|uniref:UDP-N-acetylmuramoyl-L-alanyl-D-glutamate--2, 6-diaminopimelate ligase n=1 Tax=Coxiella-like endosymbiont TaxID=1592897 RepID=UPI00272DC399|nr:UDP-N-acetylmuramoyl-L-alanyl-D-glutamate--2,6-diaminopimelate ligase [Coxiella-like endosymbiont]